MAYADWNSGVKVNLNTGAGVSAKTLMEQTAVDTAQWQLTQAQEAWDLEKKKVDQSSQLAGQFLSEWSGMVSGMKDIYGQAFNALSGLTGTVTSAGTAVTEKLTGIADTIGKEYENYAKTYFPAEAEFIQGAREEALARKGAVKTFQEGLQTDYAGVEGRAAADVRTQGEAATLAEQRKMMAMGIDPSSGKFGALSKKDSLGRARDTAIAMNVARRGEKERVTNLATTGLQNLDPAKQAGTAIAIRKSGTDLLSTQAGVLGKSADVDIAQKNLVGNIATATGNLASSYGSNVVAPMGEMAGYFTGKSGGVIPMS